MSRDLVYNFGANTEGVDAGIQEVKAALEELLRANLENARASNVVYSDMTAAQKEEFRARFESEADFQWAAKELRDKRADAERAALREYRDEHKKVFGEVESQAKNAGESIADSTVAGLDDATASAKDLGSSVSGELTEAFKSFDGTASGALEGTVGLLGGAAALLPGIGAAAGVAFTEVGKSIIGGLAESTEAAAARAESRIDAMYETLLESGRNFFERGDLEERIKTAWDDEDMVRRATNVANALNIPVQKAMAALIENGDAAKSMLAELDATLEGYASSPTASAGYVARFEAARDALIKTNEEFDTTLGKVQLVRQTLDYLPGGVTDTITEAKDLGVELDRLANPRTVDVGLRVDEAPLEALFAKQRTLRVQIVGQTRDGRVTFP